LTSVRVAHTYTRTVRDTDRFGSVCCAHASTTGWFRLRFTLLLPTTYTVYLRRAPLTTLPPPHTRGLLVRVRTHSAHALCLLPVWFYAFSHLLSPHAHAIARTFTAHRRTRTARTRTLRGVCSARWRIAQPGLPPRERRLMSSFASAHIFARRGTIRLRRLPSPPCGLLVRSFCWFDARRLTALPVAFRTAHIAAAAANHHLSSFKTV